MKRMIVMAAVVLVAAAGAVLNAEEKPRPALQLENLMRAELAGVDSTEVIISRITAEAGAAFPSHYHPGEEFIYVLEGSGTVHLQGDPAVTLTAGDVFKVPLERVHSAKVGEHGMKAIVFRVHAVGQPERILAQ